MTRLLSVLQENLEKDAKREILFSSFDGRSWTGKNLSFVIKEIKDKLKAQNIGTNDVVVLALENTVLYPIIEQALWELGAIAHPIAPTTALVRLKNELFEYQYKAIFVDKNNAGEMAKDVTFNSVIFGVDGLELYLFINQKLAMQAPRERKETDLALILNTSGTTGKPKRVGISFEQLWLATQINARAHHVDKHQTSLIVMPMFHINAQIVSTLTTRVMGGRLVVASKFSARRFWKTVAKYKVDWICVVPTIIKILVENKNSRKDFEYYKNQIHLKFVKSSSFSLPKNFIDEFEKIFAVKVIEGYGMTEATTIAAINPFEKTKSSSVGLAVGTEIRLYDEINDELFDEPDRIGEVVLSGPRVMKSYLDLKPNSHIRGWFRTGDLGRFDDEKYLYIVGRIKEIINRGGEQIAPARVEAILSMLKFVKDVVVVGIPNELYGEEVAAVLIIDVDSSIDEKGKRLEIEKIAKASLAKYERPTQIYFVDHYPVNPTGKVLRRQLVEQLMKERQGCDRTN